MGWEDAPEVAPQGSAWSAAPLAEDLEAERQERIGRLADIMQATSNVDRKAAVLEISTKTGADPAFVEGQFDFWKGLAEAGTSPQEFYEKNPELAAIALDQPWHGELVTRDKGLTTLQRLLGGFRTFVGLDQLDQLEREMYGAPQFEGENRSFLRAIDPARHVPGEVEGVSPPVKQEVLQAGETSKLTGVARQVGGYRDGKWVPGIYQYRAGRSFQSTELGALGLRYAGSVVAGKDGYEYRKRALALRNVPEEDLQPNAVESLFLGVADLSAPEMLSLGAMVGGTAVGGLGGAVAGKVVGSVASFGTSFVMEFGNVWDFLEQRDDQGRPMDPETAVGAATVYASFAAGIETGVNLGPWAKLIGPLGAEGAKREVKAFLRGLAKDPTKRAILKRVAAQWGKTAAAEGLGEETAQGLLADMWGWYTRSRSAGLAEGTGFEPQKADPIAAIGERLDEGAAVTAATLVIGAAPGARRYVVTRNALERSVVAERQLAAITGAIPESPTAKGAPQLFAKAVELETAASGEAVTAAHIDPAGVTRLAQEANVDPVEMLRQGVGEDAARRYQEALAAGTKIEVPLAEYVTTWHAAGLAEPLAPDTTTRASGVMTPRERAEHAKEIQADVTRLVAEVDSAEDKPTPSEQLFTDLAKGLADAGKLKQSKVEPQVKLWRKFVRTEAVRNGVDVEDVAKDLVIRVAAAHADVAPIQALTQKEQPPVLAKESGAAPAAGPRGWLDTVRQGARRTVSIFLGEQSDLSTFLHETGHAFWELKADLAEAPLAPQLRTDVDAAKRKEASRADFQAALEFMGVPNRAELDARAKDATAIRAKAEAEKRALTADEKAQVKALVEPFEKWARGFEAFLLEGKAPSLALAGAFRSFMLWLGQVYRNALALNVQLTPEIRGVFDRMLATDEELAAAARQIGVSGQALEAAKSRAEVAALKEVQRATETWWKDELRAETERADAEYERLPAVMAWRLLRRGATAGLEALRAFGDEVRLDRATVVEIVGQEAAEARWRGVLKRFDPRTGEGGVHPDHLAAALGVETGRQLVEAMMNVPDRKAWVEARAAEAMAVRHPGILEERARLQDLVGKALHDEPAVTEELHRQLTEDRKKAGKGAGPSVEAIRAAARLIVGRQLVQQLDPRRYYFAERDAVRRRARAEAKGDAAAAALASQQRLLNHHLYREATLARERAEQVQELAEKLLAQKGQEQLGKASPVYRDLTLRLLHKVGLVDIVPAEVDQVGLLELAKAFEAQDLEPDFDTDVISGLLATPRAFADLRVSELGEVHDALKQIRRAARNRNTVVVAGQRVSLDALVGDIRSEASRLPKKAPPPEVTSQRTIRQGPVWTTAQGFLATITDPLTTYLDDDYLGPKARQAIRDRYYKARGVEHELLGLVATKVAEAFDGMPKEMKRRLYDQVDRSMLPRIPGQRREGKVDRSWMLQLLANLGNPGNTERLLQGRGWTMDQVREFFRVNALTAEEARFVEGLWKLNDLHLWHRIVGVHEAVNGTRPGKVEAAPLTLELAGGQEVTLSGGYWPAMYDPKDSALGRKQEDVTTVSEQNYDTFRAALLKGFTRKRSESVADVVRLDDFGNYPAHVLKVIRYIAYEEFVRDAGRVFAAIRDDIEDRLGAPAYEQLDRWLKVVASGSPDSVGSVERHVIRAMGMLTSKVVLTSMMLNMRNAMADLATPLMTMTGPKGSRVRADFMLGALLEGTAGLVSPSATKLGWWAMRKEAIALSPELQVRANESARRMRDQFQRFGASGKRWQPLKALGSRVEPGRLLDVIHHHGFILQHVAETWGTTIAWEAAYRQAKAKQVGDAEAVRRADDIIQKVWPSHVAAEQSALIRSTVFRGFGVFMHGFFNRMAQRTRQTLHPAMVEWGNAEGWGEHAKAGLTAAESGFMTLGLWFVMNVVGSLIEGRGPEDDEETIDWVKRKMVSAPLVILPFVSELAPLAEAAVADEAIRGKLKYSASERASPAVSSLFRLMDSLGRLADQEAEEPKQLWAAYELVGLAFGLPVSQVKRSGQYLYDLEAGENVDVWKLIYGDNPKAPENPGEFFDDTE